MCLIAASLLIVVGIDYLTDRHVSMLLPYLVPVTFSALRLNRCGAQIIAILCAVLLTLRNPHDIQEHYSPGVLAWNTATLCAAFLFFSLCVTTLRNQLEKERRLARTDFLTGLANRRAFMSTLDQEVARVLRHQEALSLIYIDVDGFKTVNDQSGHAEGDRLLYAIADVLRQTLRSIDSIARLGGDEFIVLLPNTQAVAAKLVAHRLQEKLLLCMQDKAWPVTFSMGVLTSQTPNDAEALIHRVDELMYSAKNGGKNQLVFEQQLL